MMMRNRRAGGYSLVEMVAALTIFGIGVLGMMELFTTCLQSTSASLGHTHAVYLAQGLLEEIIVEGGLYAGSDSGDFSSEYPRHSWTYEIEDMDQTGLMQVRVVVTWDERGRQKEFALTTLVAERLLL
jgi:prepilin-type N-terminal cleavage/methylation domain-containing protein